VITSSFNHFKKIINESDFNKYNGVTWEDLEDFAISLTAWSKKYIKVMSQLTLIDFDILKDKRYKPLDYQPTTFQQLVV